MDDYGYDYDRNVGSKHRDKFRSCPSGSVAKNPKIEAKF